MLKVAVIGTTSWGTTLGVMLARKGIDVRLWARTKREAARLMKRGPNNSKEITFPPQLSITSDIGEAIKDATAVILAVPSQTMRQNISMAASHIGKSMLIISASKGLEIGSGKRMSEVIAEEINPNFKSNICVLSGPNLSREVLHELPAATVIAAEKTSTVRKAQKLMASPNFCVFTNSDVIGVELGGALKNIIALGAGIADGLEYGDNAKAAFMTRGLTEITALGVTLGANPLTFSGLAGLGDVIATCASPLSRNHYVGEQLAKGQSLTEIMDTMTEVAEGVSTTLAARDLSQRHELGMPITEKIYEVLYEDVDPRQAAAELMGGNARHELSGRRWKLFSLFRREKHSPEV
ncbi:NAD(P)H-dependent glycerol-3-phosphate dehydrogenase [Chloroflexota bacterium]